MVNTSNIYPISAIGEALSRSMSQYRDQPVLLLVSGGSALKALDEIGPFVLGPYLTVSVLDERVNTRPEDQNFFQLTQGNFYKKALVQGVKFISLEKLSIDSREIVIAVMGIGLDGHTAGIMPFPEDKNKFKELFEGDKLLVEYDADNKNQYPLRLTVTISFLLDKVAHAFVYVRGEEKKGILGKVLASTDDLAAYPARVIHHMKNIEIYTDLTN